MVKKEQLLLAMTKIHCCPYCGAKLEIVDGKCSACGMVINESLIRRMIFSISGAKEKLGIIQGSLDLLGSKIAWLKTRIRDKLYSTMRESFVRARKDEKKLSDLNKKLSELLENVYNELQNIGELQVKAIDINSLDAYERAYNSLIDFINKYREYVDMYSISAFVIPEFAIHIAEYLNKASRVIDAVEWYSMALTSVLYPPSSPNQLPKDVAWAEAPISVAYIYCYDADFDGVQELFAVPSNAITALKVPCILISDFGKVWSPLQGYEALLPLFGRYGEFSVITVGWRNRNLFDASFLVGGSELRIIDKEKKEVKFSIPVLDIWRFDIDENGIDELVVSSNRGMLGVLRPSAKGLELESWFFGSVSSVDYVGKRLFVLTLDGRLLSFEPENNNVVLIDKNIPHTDSAIIKAFSEDGVVEIYLSTEAGLYRYVEAENGFENGKIRDGDVLGAGLSDVDGDGEKELVVVVNDGRLTVEIYKKKAFLGGMTFEKVMEFEVSTKLDRASRNYDKPFREKPIFVLEDLDGDKADEIILGGKNKILVIDFRYE